ncbi:hypothetical protein Cgig2_027743 [Carnegiea gigantea]|uniref:RING-type E3 ubiquitin transferase n=1 Tax=Carnegiea gigantea TaxID=171969 RepID=A0A9Q1JW73_9CARY|nr:hypothetical protein Cgig2_027743 [Carnegiea gigantea]
MVVFDHCPRTSEERQPLSAHRDGPSGSSAGLLVDTNLDTSVPDTYAPPPPPVPYDVNSGHPQSGHSPGGGINYVSKGEIAAERTDAGTTEVLNSVDSPQNLDKEIDGKEQSILELTPSKDSEDDLKRTVDPIVMTIEEEDCPICLEAVSGVDPEYAEENPKMVTKCEHHFHLCCILEWLERSDSCPVCGQELVIDEELQ